MDTKSLVARLLDRFVHETTQDLPRLMLSQIKRLIEKMIEAKKEKKDSLDAKGM